MLLFLSILLDGTMSCFWTYFLNLWLHFFLHSFLFCLLCSCYVGNFYLGVCVQLRSITIDLLVTASTTCPLQRSCQILIFFHLRTQKYQPIFCWGNYDYYLGSC